MQPQFPFSAVIAQEPLKLALLLNVVEPQLGGVLISGPRGSGKSTLARGLTDIAGFSPEQFVNLPLGASEEQLTGALHLEKALANGEVSFNPGLLSRAHEGVLYVDEVNLLPDTLVDLLLDVAASGINRVERDGISHAHAARFLLVGTMNPDEGELRPQLLDRFALCVHLDAQLTAEERVRAVQHRLAFDEDPEAFRARYQSSQQAMRERLQTARARLPGVQLGEPEQLLIAERCAAAGVEGLRADICLQRASRAFAAWMGEPEVNGAIVDAVSELVLCHRRQHQPAAHTSSQVSEPQQPPRQQQPQQRPQSKQESQQPAPADAADNAAVNSRTETPATYNSTPALAQAAGSWGEMPAQTAAFSQSTPALQPFRLASGTAKKKTLITTPERYRNSLIGQDRGTRNQRSVTASTSGSALNWFATLSHPDNLPLRSNTRRLSRAIFKPQQQPQQHLHLLVLDTSASSLGQQALNQALSACGFLCQQAYLARQHCALISFGNNRAQVLIPPQRAVKHLSAYLGQIDAGGGTPLRLGMEKARLLLQQYQHRYSQQTVYLLSDGRSKDTINDLDLPCPLVVIDTEQARVPLARARQLAEQLDAQYLHLRSLPSGN